MIVCYGRNLSLAHVVFPFPSQTTNKTNSMGQEINEDPGALTDVELADGQPGAHAQVTSAGANADDGNDSEGNNRSENAPQTQQQQLQQQLSQTSQNNEELQEPEVGTRL